LQKPADQKVLNWDQVPPNVLVVDPDQKYGQKLVMALRHLSVHAKHTRSVDEFLDAHCQNRIDLVSLVVDPMDPVNLDSIRLLRTHFGEGPGTMIVASSNSILDAFAILVEQRGADTCLAKHSQPEAMATALINELRQQIRSNKPGLAAMSDQEE